MGSSGDLSLKTLSPHSKRTRWNKLMMWTTAMTGEITIHRLMKMREIQIAGHRLNLKIEVYLIISRRENNKEMMNDAE